MKRIIRYFVSIAGSSIVGIGVGLCVLTGLGADALGVLWEGIADKLSLTVGQASLLVTSCCLVLVFFIDKKELGPATVLNPIATSICTDLVIRQAAFPELAFPFKLLLVLIGVSFIGIGSGMAAAANVGKESYIALCFALSSKRMIDLAKVRIVLDLICFISGMLLGGKLMLGPLVGILLIGPLLKVTSQYCSIKLAAIKE
ncbi:YczE/YyaS/YitT family protein [Enterococcus sp. LJL128]|uniref:YczE/YyaS/YitT family protein n=1 Tax=Enterococcus sp. LJL51 TaxID=3416656 RepID=UPI003CF4C709